MKLIGQMMILFTGLVFGVWGIKREERYIELVEELQLGLSIVENEIAFSLKPLPESFLSAASSLRRSNYFFKDAAEKAREGSICLFNLELLPLKEMEKKVMYEVGIRLGRGTDEEQTALIVKAISRLEESRLIYREKLKKVSPLWRWLSPLTALLVVLLTC